MVEERPQAHIVVENLKKNIFIEEETVAHLEPRVKELEKAFIDKHGKVPKEITEEEKKAALAREDEPFLCEHNILVTLNNILVEIKSNIANMKAQKIHWESRQHAEVYAAKGKVLTATMVPPKLELAK